MKPATVRLAQFLLLSSVCLPSAGLSAADWLDPDGIKGSLVIAGGGALPQSVVAEFVSLSGGKDARLIVIPTASDRADDAEAGEEFLKPWRDTGIASLTVLHTRDRVVADSSSFCDRLRDATAVWFDGGSQSRIAEAYVGTRFEAALQRVLDRGGVVGGTSAGAAIQSRLMIASGNPIPDLKQGFDLLPDAVIDQHFVARKRQPRLEHSLKSRPGHFGVGVDEGTAVIVQGRSLRVAGDSTVTIILPAGGGRDRSAVQLKDGQKADLTALRRAARDRMSESAFPLQAPEASRVENGSLLIIGGGGMTDDMVRRFIEKAGGGQARIVILPVSSETAQQSGDSMKRLFEQFGAQRVTVLPQRLKADVERDDVLMSLRTANGLWFGGGRQWRFMDAYEGTAAEPLIHNVLRRGGVIGGSSAGASIQSEYMVRGNPLGNFDMMAAGYERGLGFLKGVTIDQHFTQRNRHADLDGVIRRFPQLLGIGLDETTAILVEGSQAEVLGKHAAWFVEVGAAESADLKRRSFREGAIFDLVTRRELRPSVPPLPEDVPGAARRVTRPAAR